jgi:phosphoglycolate phosphatase-like HAD superfamily hydrolase
MNECHVCLRVCRCIESRTGQPISLLQKIDSMRRFILLFFAMIACIRQSLCTAIRSLKMSSSSVESVTLLTFDVDGTLLQGSSKRTEASAHAKAFNHAIGKVFLNDHEFEKKHESPLKFVPHANYHGSTDGLIAMNLAYYSSNIEPHISYSKLSEIFKEMYAYISSYDDADVSKGMEVLPGVLETLRQINDQYVSKGKVMCGLVTGNVENIARKKMRATGIFQTKIFSPRAPDQLLKGDDDAAMLGGFGSDYCSGDIHDTSRMFKDRGEQIAIATRRAKSMLLPHQRLVRVVHIGDAPNDILAAKYCAENKLLGDDVAVGCIGVATGKFSSDELQSHAGSSTERWDPVILEKGIADPRFISSLRII